MSLYMTEADLQDAVIDLARRLNWRVVHFRPALTEKGWRTPLQGDKGFVDLVLAKGGQVLHIELKSSIGSLAPDQKAWRDALGDTWRLWRPDDWRHGLIDRELGLVTA